MLLIPNFHNGFSHSVKVSTIVKFTLSKIVQLKNKHVLQYISFCKRNTIICAIIMVWLLSVKYLFLQHQVCHYTSINKI